MTADVFVCGVRIGGVWRIARASRVSRACVAGIGRSPATAFNSLFARIRRAV